MEEGLWELFFLTGLPEVWLLLHGLDCPQGRTEETAMPAFLRQTPERAEC